MIKTADTSVQELLSEEDRAFIERIAKRIYDSGFITAAVFALEMVKPLALLGSHTMIFFGPIVSAFIKADGYYRAAELFEEPRNVEFLIARLEQYEEEKNNKQTEKHSER
ncbi:MAG: hypothetical protein K9M49_06735 [Candidatus Marinimicrobia bacterium]|nr:hypothetical protein [Candidatus Neomarinimicrobiota bacterium]MCF7850078.1 hypothetical protein [Candidatus Neomarinimicrobiota bacterium]MCF7904834.1 hypothetical protein [Candidatus Neomarinimicrobiota bacterium]